ncbi:MAG: mechanosensitive ion channel, partial [Euryhalocaulis sp.]|uniref:mechanosensitive ion channel family protein n=1 Tax=Euryhalocaulis sp. TaxID=2744307 RepID=UPI0017D13042
GQAGVAGLAIGFALKDTVANYIASTLLTLRRPFEANDIVRIGDQEGTVARLTPRSTILITTDGNHVSVPNGTVIQSVIVNFTRRPQRRFSFEVGIGAADDAGKACRVTRDAIVATQGVIADPAPACIVKAFGNYNLILEASGWVDQRASSFLSVRGLAIAAVRDALLAQGIDLPDPIVQVRQLGEAAPAEAAAPKTARTDLQDMAEQQPESEAAEQAAREAEEGENLMKKAAPE